MACCFLFFDTYSKVQDGLFAHCHNKHTIINLFFGRPEYFIIREVYEQGGLEDFENELDQALDMETETIVIEPIELGLETARWISVGNFLHKTSVVCGLATAAFSHSNKLQVLLPLGCTSFICAGVYLISWQFDPCCKYQVEKDMRNVGKLPLHKLVSSSPVVLVRKDDSRRKILHNTLALLSISICCWKIYKSYA